MTHMAAFLGLGSMLALTQLVTQMDAQLGFDSDSVVMTGMKMMGNAEVTPAMPHRYARCPKGASW